MAPPPLVVGFDLDLTLIDSRPGIGAVLEALSVETGVAIDVALVQSRLGPPLDVELALWFPADDVPAMSDRFRELYPDLAIESSPALPGAAEALASVRAAGGASVVVTAKYAPNAQLHLDHLGLAVDSLEGWRWAEAKGEALLEHGASVYVGDHPADMAGARLAGAIAVGVTTGGSTAADLEAAGAEVVLDSLHAFPGWLDEHLLALRLAALDAHLRSLGSVVVAFSGGADSAFLLAAAVEALGPFHVVAATAVSDSLATGELEQAQDFARELGVRHLAPRTYELARDGYRANSADRCYFCKAELLDVLRPEADRLAIRAVATGTNADDALAGFRPGIRAADERGAVTPLRDVGMTKAQIREASRRWGLPTWDKPQAACLSSRVAYGIEVTPARLARVDRAEAALRAALDEACIVVTDLRVRDLGNTARIEVDAAAVEDVLADPSVAEAVRLAGFDHVEVDPRGFRSGSMNEALSPTPGLG
ncbi:MAG TPA: ATP-dependent sacrificial sulfur transferase LarE [Candidatus Limnocylindria bacterium]|nr:ATP-dependent sacrificial sulfur transferase LarE [Candidatus Limnocylindria bacterium]